MISQMEFVRRVDVQSETIERYLREGMLIPDLIVPMSEHRTFNYLKKRRWFLMPKNIIGSSLMITTVLIYLWKWLNKWI